MSNENLQASIDEVRADVAKLHAELVRYNLIVWTGGNVSGRVPGADLFVIAALRLIITKDGTINPEYLTIITGGVLLVFVLLQRALTRRGSS